MVTHIHTFYPSTQEQRQVDPCEFKVGQSTQWLQAIRGYIGNLVSKEEKKKNLTVPYISP